MKKFVCFLAVFALAAPASANVVITCVDEGNGDGWVTVSYDASSEPNLVRAFALDITVTDGTIEEIADFKTGISEAATTRGYGIFMTSINLDDPQSPIWNTPIADPDDPNDNPYTLGGLDTSGITVELGSLYDVAVPGDAPDDSGPMFRLRVTENCTMSIITNDDIGGIVMEGTPPEPLPPGRFVSEGCTIIQDCMAVTNPAYSAWDDWGKPDCWCYARQCRGDADGIKTLVYWVAIPDLNILRIAINLTDSALALVPNGICADFDHIKTLVYRVAIPDLNILRAYINQLEGLVPVCSGPGSGNDEDPLPNTEYNFWKTP